MATLFDKTHIMHDPSKTEGNNKIFDNLRDLFAEIARPVVEDYFCENNTVNHDDKRNIDRTIKIATQGLSNAVISTWVTSLHRSCSEGKKAIIHSIISEPEGDIQIDFESAVSPYCVSADKIIELLPILLSRLPLTEECAIDLPLDLYIKPIEYNAENQPVSYLADMHNN